MFAQQTLILYDEFGTKIGSVTFRKPSVTVICVKITSPIEDKMAIILSNIQMILCAATRNDYCDGI